VGKVHKFKKLLINHRGGSEFSFKIRKIDEREEICCGMDWKVEFSKFFKNVRIFIETSASIE
jgi:hypothetical protein